MEPDYIIDVNEIDFQTEVIQFSLNTPVVVDFWATWCQPCRTLGPMLERLANEAEGRFRLARVDVDANPNLSMRYGIRSIPAVKGFRAGQVHSEFVGIVPEPNIKKFLRDLAPGPGDLNLLKGQSLLGQNQWLEAEENFRRTLSGNPDESAALLGLAKSLLAGNKASEAAEILKSFPASKEFPSAELLKPLAQALLAPTGLPAEEILEATYQRALELVRKGNIPAALDGLLDVIREILGNDSDLARQYRSELASALF